jgi:tetratricopeptide (TPR) repeat protein
MGKKKAVSKNNPDALKEAGNKAFQLGSFEEAIKLYTQAIEVQDNHIYYANRANAYLEIDEFQKCIDDCEMAIKLDPKYVKSYVRKGNALLNTVKVQQAIECFKMAVELEPDNQDYAKLLEEAYHELKEDSKIPDDNPVKQKFDHLFDDLRQKGCKFEKLKVRYYTQDFRGVHAAAPIKNGETVCFMPKETMITSEVAIKQDYIKDKYDQLLKEFGEGSINQVTLSIYVCVEKKNPNNTFKNFFGVLPQNYDDFPIMFSEETLQLVVGTNLSSKTKSRKD